MKSDLGEDVERGAPESTCDASVIVCTYNRAESLGHTLDCLRAQQLPPEVTWEVIVVDNNSRDETASVVEAAKSGLPVLTYEFERAQGLSNARNHGIRVARGDVLLFTDDDVCPEPDWVARALSGMREHGAAACGGYVAPMWEVAPPRWLSPQLYGFLAIRTDRTDCYTVTKVRDAPFGANMAVRRGVFEKVGVFNPDLGRKGTILASGEETELFERILAAGEKVVFLGDVRVSHRVEAFRLRRSYFRRWRYQASLSDAQVAPMEGGRRLRGVPLYLFRQLIQAMWGAMSGYVRLAPDEAFARELMVWHFLGVIGGLYRARGTVMSMAALPRSTPGNDGTG